MKPYIYVDSPIPGEVENYLRTFCEVGKWESTAPIPRPVLLEQVAGAQGLLTSGSRIDAELLDHAPDLRAVSSISVGYNHFDVDAMRQRGIVGTNTPDVLSDTVADLVFALMLGTARRVAELDRYVKEGRWQRGEGDALFGLDVHHRTLGIIGMGRIGEAIARRGKFGFEMDVVYYNRSRKPDTEQQLGVRYAELAELLAGSDFIVLMAPLTPETNRLIGREQFQAMKPDAIFINASRGQTVDEEAMIDALRSGVIRAAGLDVYEQEPLPPGHPLLGLPNVLTLPHIGSATAQTRFDMAMLAARNLVEAVSGRTPPNVVAELRQAP